MITIEQAAPSPRPARDDAHRRERPEGGPTFDEALTEAADERDRASRDPARTEDRDQAADRNAEPDDRADERGGPGGPSAGLVAAGHEIDPTPATTMTAGEELTASRPGTPAVGASNAPASVPTAEWSAPDSTGSPNLPATVDGEPGVSGGAVSSGADQHIAALDGMTTNDVDVASDGAPLGQNADVGDVARPTVAGASAPHAGIGSTTRDPETAATGASPGTTSGAATPIEATEGDTAPTNAADAPDDAEAPATPPTQSISARPTSESNDGSGADVVFDATPDQVELSAADESTPTAPTRPASREAALGGATAIRELFDRLELQRASADGSLEVEIRTERYGVVRVEAADSGEGVSLSLRGDGSNGEELHDLARELRQEFERDGRSLADVDVDERSDDRDDSSVGSDDATSPHAIPSMLPGGVDLHL